MLEVMIFQAWSIDKLEHFVAVSAVNLQRSWAWGCWHKGAQDSLMNMFLTCCGTFLRMKLSPIRVGSMVVIVVYIGLGAWVVIWVWLVWHVSNAK